MHDENTYRVYGDGLRDYVRMLMEENERRDEKTRQRLVKLRKAEFARLWRPGGEQHDEHVKAWLDSVRHAKASGGVNNSRAMTRGHGLYHPKEQTMSLASARRYGEMMSRIRERQREYEYQQTPEGKAEIARQQAEADRMAAIEAERQRKLAGPIRLVGNASGIVFGTRIEDGVDFILPVRRMQHMLIAGVAGSGKSVLMHSIIWQLVQSAEAERLLLIDLKGGVEFDRYRDSDKVRVVWEFREVADVIDELMLLMAKRQDEMRNKRWQNWPGGRVFVVIDEYAEVQTDIDAADTREEKATARRLAANLVSISRRARALGIVLVCALQKATTDAMDSSLRNNLSCRICMRSANKATAASMLDRTDELPVSPTELPTGRFYYYDASRGLYRLLQAQIAPGVDLGDVS